MAKSFKRALSLLLSLMMLAGMCSAGSVTASAADKNYTISLGQTVNVEIEAGVISGGMIPKVTSSIKALKNGVKEICIGEYKSFGDLEKTIERKIGTSMVL